MQLKQLQLARQSLKQPSRFVMTVVVMMVVVVVFVVVCINVHVCVPLRVLFIQFNSIRFNSTIKNLNVELG